MSLLGVVPLGKAVRLPDGRTIILDCGGLDDWACDRNLMVPVLIGHNTAAPVGWVTSTRLHRDRIYLFGDLDDTFDPVARLAGSMIRDRQRNGLSPDVQTSRGTRLYGDGRWGAGDLQSFCEVSLVRTPRLDAARWLAA